MTESTLIDNTYEPCAQCSAPLDDAQRYCVFCGASRHHAADPVARYLAAARQRPAAPPAVVAPAPSARSDRWLVIALALVPLAAGIGVLAGRSSSGNDALVAALRAQKAPIVQIGAGAATGAAASTPTAAAARSSPAAAFPLTKGFTVALQTLAASANTGTAINGARAKGAKEVGVLDPAVATITPDPGSKLVLYAGAFKTKAAAMKALTKLKKKFPGAKVVAVERGGAADDAPVPKHPTAKQKADGTKIVKQIQATKGKSYVDQQRQLPDTIVVP